MRVTVNSEAGIVCRYTRSVSSASTLTSRPPDQVHRRGEMPQSHGRVAGHVDANKTPAVGAQCGGGAILAAVLGVAVRLLEQRLDMAPVRFARPDFRFILPAAAIAARVL